MKAIAAATETENAAATPKLAKTATITLHAADGSTMQIVAERQGEGARTYVLTTGTDKKTTRGMTATHHSWDVAVAHTASLAKAAGKLGWVRRVAGRHFVAKPDAFSALPAAPKGKK